MGWKSICMVLLLLLLRERVEDDFFDWREVSPAQHVQVSEIDAKRPILFPSGPIRTSESHVSQNFFLVLIPINSYPLLLPTINKGSGYSQIT